MNWVTSTLQWKSSWWYFSTYSSSIKTVHRSYQTTTEHESTTFNCSELTARKQLFRLYICTKKNSEKLSTPPTNRKPSSAQYVSPVLSNPPFRVKINEPKANEDSDAFFEQPHKHDHQVTSLDNICSYVYFICYYAILIYEKTLDY